jgi:hypothetical protein
VTRASAKNLQIRQGSTKNSLAKVVLAGCRFFLDAGSRGRLKKKHVTRAPANKLQIWQGSKKKGDAVFFFERGFPWEVEKKHATRARAKNYVR